MKDEIFKDLKTAYKTGEFLVSTKSLIAEATEQNFTDDYDFRLLTIFFTDLADEEDKDEHPLVEVRIKHTANTEGEIISLVFQTQGAKKEVEDIDEELKFVADLIETYTEKFLNEFPDCILRWDFLGQEE